MTKIKKTFSLDPKVVDIIKSKCNGNQTKFVQDCIKSAAFEGCSDCDQEIHDTMRQIIDNIHNSLYTITDSEKTGKIIKAVLVWPENDDEF